jgi:hypothetical protein
VRDELVLETSLVGPVPRSLEQDAELLARLRELVLEREKAVLAGVPHRRAPCREHRGEGERKERARGVAREIEIAAHQHAAGFAEE